MRSHRHRFLPERAFRNVRRAGCAAVAMLSLYGCGGDDAPAADEELTVAPADTQSFAATQPDATQQLPALTAADVDAYERGLARENELLRQAIQRRDRAGGAADTMQAMMSGLPQETEAEGARAASVPLDRYRRIKEGVGQVIGAAEMGGALRQQLSEVDTTEMDAESRARLRENMEQMSAAFGDPYAGLDPQVAGTIRDRRERLAQLRAENIGLLFQLAGR